MQQIHFIILIVSLILFSGCSEDNSPIIQANKGTITGKVTDQLSGNAISEATLKSQPVTKTIITDENGNYSITEIDAGSYTLTVNKDGYIPNTANAKVTSNQTTNINITLSVLPPEPANPKIYINLFQNKEIIDTAQIKITVEDTAKIQEVSFFVDGIPTLSFNQKDIQFIWEVPAFVAGSSHQIYCTAKNIYNKIDTSEIFNIYTFKLDTVIFNNIIASEDSIFADWTYPGQYFDSFHISFTIRNNGTLVFSETKSVPLMYVIYKDFLNYSYDYTLEVASEFKGHRATNYVTKFFELSPIPKLDSLITPSIIHPASNSHVEVKVKVTSADKLENIDVVNLYLYRPDSTSVRFDMHTTNLNTTSGFYTNSMSLGPQNVPVLGTYRFEVEAIHKKGGKSNRLIKTIIFG